MDPSIFRETLFQRKLGLTFGIFYVGTARVTRAWNRTLSNKLQKVNVAHVIIWKHIRPGYFYIHKGIKRPLPCNRTSDIKSNEKRKFKNKRHK